MIRTNKIYKLMNDFLKCGLTGLILEVVFTSLGSILTGDFRMTGTTSLLMFPIYGMGALLAPIGSLIDQWLKVSDLKPSNLVNRILRHGLLYMVLIFIAEYIYGMYLKSIGICPWDYTGRLTSIHGLIRLDFAPLWFGTGLLFEQITKTKI